MGGVLRLAKSFVTRPAVAAALLSLAENATVIFIDSAIVKLQSWEKELRRLDEVITVE